MRVMLAAIAAALLCAATATAASDWRPYQLPAGARDLPIVWGDCGDHSGGCFSYGDDVEVNPATRGNLWRILEGQPRVPLDELIYLHELGHWFDQHHLTPALRDRFQQIAGTSRDWSMPPDAPDERFAQAFALCALYPVPPRLWPTRPTWGLAVYGWSPGRRQHLAACSLIATATEETP